MKVSDLTRVATREITAYPDPDALPEGFTKLDANESPYAPSPLVISAIADQTKFLNRYPTDPKLLRQRIAEYAHASPSEIILGNGSDEIIDLLVKGFLNPGDQVVVSIPTFQMYEVAAKLADAMVKKVKMLQGFRWDTEGILSAGERTKMVFLCSPNNPTGNVLLEGEAETMADADALIVIDEAYAEFAERSLRDRLIARNNVVFLRTFSKAFALAGLRIGYAVSSPEVIEVLARVKAPYNVNRLALAAAHAALRDLEHMRRLVELTKLARSDLIARLSRVPKVKAYPSEANFVLLEVKHPSAISGDPAGNLWKQGFAVRDCSKMEGLTGGFIRVTVGTPWQNERFVQCLQSLLGQAHRNG